MADIDVPLPKGSPDAEHLPVVAVLRALTTAAINAAGEEAERCVQGPDGQYHLVTSPTLSGVHLLRRQIRRLVDKAGTTILDGPLSLDLFARLDPADFVAVQDAAERLDAAGQAALSRMADRGRGGPSS